MEPGSEDPGYMQPSSVDPSARSVLQWSRGPKTPDTCRHRPRCRGQQARLQWSRGPKTPDTLGLRQPGPGLGGFNGAGVRRPRILDLFWEYPLGSMGFNGAGVRRPRIPRRSARYLWQARGASMEPGSEDPGYDRSPSFSCQLPALASMEPGSEDPGYPVSPPTLFYSGY